MLQISLSPRMLTAPLDCKFMPQIFSARLQTPTSDAVKSHSSSFLGRRSRPQPVRVMEKEIHRYVAVDTSHQEGQYVDSKDPCSSGRKDGSYVDTPANDGPLFREIGDYLMEDTLYLGNVGQVTLTLSDTHLLWHSVEDENQKLNALALLCCRNTQQFSEGHLPLAEIFAVKSLDFGPVNQGKVSLYGGSLPPKQLHRVEVHTFLRSDGKWVPKVYVFGHTDAAVVQRWAQKIKLMLLEDYHRPKSLLVFVNPYGGKGSGVQTWKRVQSLFELANIKVTVITTERAGHARSVMERATKDELDALDGVVVVGGDGFFNEVLNGLVMHRHKARAAVVPQRLNSFYKKRTLRQQRDSEVNLMFNDKGGLKSLLGDPNTSLGVPVQDEEGNFLQPSTVTTADPIIGTKRKGDESPGTRLSNIELENPNTTLSNTNPDLRIGIIPAGSTDTVAISITGTRDPLTSALHIILGDSMPLDIVRITGWKNPPESSRNERPEVRYAASFAGYGFYGDVMRESEVLRWMGPARYDIAGTLVFLKHKTYEAEISFLDIPQGQSDPQQLKPQGPWTRKSSFKPPSKKIVCLANCAVCAGGFDFSSVINSESDTEGFQQPEGMDAPTWKTRRAKFHSIGAAVMSCRNEKAPEGVAAHAHLADGLLHLILIRECSRPDYLRQLLRLTRRGADPFDFSFVEHYKTPLFTFKSQGDRASVWNVDGELLLARQVTGQVFRGLVTLFARGPEI